jgi:hypothetical protein
LQFRESFADQRRGSGESFGLNAVRFISGCGLLLRRPQRFNPSLRAARSRAAIPRRKFNFAAAVMDRNVPARER